MAQQQQTVLRVQTNIPAGIEITGSTTLSVVSTTGMTQSGSGTQVSPINAATNATSFGITLNVSGGTGTFYYSLNLQPYAGSSLDLYTDYNVKFNLIKSDGSTRGMGGFIEYATSQLDRNFVVEDGDTIVITGGNSIPISSTLILYVEPSSSTTFSEVLSYDTLDLYTDIPIKLNKSFAEIQDIAKRNSDYSIGLSLPGSKKNNAFFENYYNVDTNSLYFDVTRRVNIDVLLNDEVYFKGYMRLNKVSVLNSKVEYDVTLYSTVADLYGQIGNNLLKDLDYDDIDWHFNHYFNMWNVTSTWNYNTLQNGEVIPSLWMYPVVHNGYEYSGDTVNVSGATSGSTRLYTSTSAGTYASYNAFTGSPVNGLEYRINSPKNPILDNQLKPALNIYALMNLLFKNYGYTIKSEFFKTPWFKLLYMYGFYSYDGTKFGYKTPVAQVLPLEGVDVILRTNTTNSTQDCLGNPYPLTSQEMKFYVVKKGTGIPCQCSSQINIVLDFLFYPCGGSSYQSSISLTVPPNSTGVTYSYVESSTVECGFGCVPESQFYEAYNTSLSNVVLSSSALAYLPLPSNARINFEDGNYVDFSLVMDENLKQIDFIASIAKKFNLVIIPDPEVPNQMIIEPYDYYIGSGAIYDWTDKLSFDKGFTVQPALNFIESELILTDQEDGDEANKTYKDRNKLIYGENRVYNPTDFKSQSKKIDTIFSPEVIRKWDERIGIPLGINYAGQSNSQSSGGSEKVTWKYTGLKSKPRLIFNNGNFSPFLNKVGQSFNFAGTNVNTIFFRIQPSNGINPYSNVYAFATYTNPVISHTMPMGNKDENKSGRGFNNDSICVLFNSEEPDDIGLGIPTFNAFTENDSYKLFYANRINNLYDKNTRFLQGNFDLKLSDIKNLKPNDLIKIQEQYFYVNKLEGFDLTNPELTSVELIQTNNAVRPTPYPIRYFKYRYCNETNDYTYKFRTYFNPEDNTNGTIYTTSGETANSLRRTYYYWSIYYDYMVGVLGGSVSGVTSSYNNGTAGAVWAYTMTEITESEYNNSNYLFWFEDDNDQFFIDRFDPSPDINKYTSSQLVYTSSNQVGQDKAFFNIAANCFDFSTYAATNGVTISPAPGTTPASPYTTGTTLNITDTGWIKYDTATGTVYRYFGSLGVQTIPDCADCTTIRFAFPFADLANWNNVVCGSPC